MSIINVENELMQGYRKAIIDLTHNSALAFSPEFLYNEPKKGKKVLVSLEQELAACDEFKISVAFITKSGLTPLLQVLKDLEAKGIPGKILTTDYLNFSEPEALETLENLSNIELKMYLTNSETGGFHTKGYIFRQEEIYRIIIGSSNMTLGALTKNREWNFKIVSREDGELASSVLGEFDDLWEDSRDYSEVKEQYKLAFLKEKIVREQRKVAASEKIIDIETAKLKPNAMQIAFIEKLLEMIKSDVKKAMLLSSTGTGKTLASAFAMRELKPERVLFVVHREQIAKQALKSYRRIFGSTKTYGLLSGSHQEIDAQFLFSTMQMMAKPEIHQKFAENDFDVVILDECHHAGSESYQRIMGYFKPKFWLGMTASPDTNNYDVYSLFDHNIAYEIRLQQALDENLLCPFHYFGITDLEIDGEVFDDNTGIRNFARLVSDARVSYVIEKAEYFGYSGERVKGLIFCSRKEEAKELSAKFNHRRKKNGDYYRTAVLTGEDSQEIREKVIDRLTDDKNQEEQLDYIFTVDIFNEGVDVPEINQVIMLRPTESPVVFIQQLGRGLRKFEGKEYVVIIDFIGNYMNNFMIPIALSGDRSYNKDTMRRYVREGAKVIPGSSTIHFDEISKKRIYSSIDGARTNDMKLLKESYLALKYKLGRIPSISEFKQYGSIDITKIFEKCNSYHEFLKKYEDDYNCELSKEEETVIEYMSKKLVLYKRIHELALLEELILKASEEVKDFEQMLSIYGVDLTKRAEESAYRNLANLFPKTAEQDKYRVCVLIEKTDNQTYKLTDSFKEMLNHSSFRAMVEELLVFGIERYIDNYSDVYKDTCFELYKKYTYEDVCRLLCWEKNLNAQNIGGYFYDANTKTMPVFINYDKAEDAIAYEDRFVSENRLIALSKHPRRIESGDADHIYKRKPEDKDNRIYLFVRKNKDDNEAKEFYFLGEIFAEGEPQPIHMETTNDDAFEINYRLDVAVRTDIYDYIVRD